MISCVYSFTSPSGGVYVGSTRNLRKRLSRHMEALRANRHHSIALQRAFNKYKSLKFEILLICDRKFLILNEQHFINILKPRYNMNPVAGSSAGVKRSPEYKKNASAKTALVWQRPGYRENHSTAMRLKFQDENFKREHSEKIKTAWRNKRKRARILSAQRQAAKAPWSEERKKRHSTIAKALWNNPSFRAKMAEARR